jgi:hypothetical protein
MKHRIGLNSDLFTHLRLFYTDWFKSKGNKYVENAKGAKGAYGGNGNCTWRVQQIIRGEVLNHEVPNFPSLFGHTL